ncbi:metallophosphoesterase family protein [Alkalihalobacterium alkalinitrilicum]|uniref:metallophosphoesterase family protein n=1 Tax=Alkalihalobacterium alkalinitrilicum TaxID=427920 RepID=UPI0009952C9D|nr:metallophosphoesterase family protein [Alkalihalobacterium alkalinitrilicum]
MDKIAVISDIHGNTPALDAVLEDINKRHITHIICLGDLVGKGPHSSHSIDKVKETCELVVMGNWDDFITKETKFDTLRWHQQQLREDQVTYLEQLPFSVDFYMSGRLVRLFHASPRSLYERIQPWDELDKRLSLFNNSELTDNIKGEKEPDVVGYGDVHNAYVQNLQGKTLFNCGSVGNPLEITQASYAILEGEYQSEQLSSFSIQFVRVPYDIELAIQQAKDVNMPELEDYIKELTTARYRGLKD